MPHWYYKNIISKTIAYESTAPGHKSHRGAMRGSSNDSLKTSSALGPKETPGHQALDILLFDQIINQLLCAGLDIIGTRIDH